MRPLATSKAPQILLLGMFSRLGDLALLSQIWTKYECGCTAGTGERLGSTIPSKVLSRAKVCWSTAISKTSFTKKNQGSPLNECRNAKFY